MTNIYNTNNLYWVFTKYAKERLADFNKTDNLALRCTSVGDYDWFTDEEHKLGEAGYSEEAFKAYFQEKYRNELGHAITAPNADEDLVPIEFPIVSKEITQSQEEVILTTVIDEEYGGFDIREIGIYEEVDGENKLFAICTLQPIPRPSNETHHYISSQINCHLFSQKLVTIFDNILINKTNNFVTKDELQNYQSNLLFIESNLAEQISRNSQIIGYNRVQQLYELMTLNQDNYAKFGMSTIYSNLANNADISNFWVFNYSGNLTRKAMLKDLSLNNENLGTDQLSTRYSKGYEGITTWLNFDNAHYYTLDIPSDVTVTTKDDGTKEYKAPTRDNLFFVDLQKDDKGVIKSVSDAPFTIVFVGAQNNNSEDSTILAKYNTYTEHPGLKIQVTKERECAVTLYTNINSYVKFVTPPGSIPKAGTFYSLIISYNGNSEEPELKVIIDGSSVRTISTNTKTLYKGMTIAGMMLPIYSFERTGDGDKKHVNAKVCLLSLIRGNLSFAQQQALSYNLMSLIGHNPCLV